MVYKCFKCNKEFKYESKLNEHKNRKIPCNKEKEELKCSLCNVFFTRPSHKKNHEKTQKHISNYNKVNQTNVNGDNINHIGDNYTNILNLTLNVQSFKNTNTSYIRKFIIEDIGERIYIETINKKYISETEKCKILFNSVLEILEKLHFNLNLDENHNLKILLIFPAIKKKIYEYLILDINSDTNKIIWISLDYDKMIDKILHHLYKLNNKIQNNNYDKFLMFLEQHLIKNKEFATELKPYIEQKLGELYINFNEKQKKEAREIKSTFEEKIIEYKNYRKEECTLENGFLPNVVNSDF
jgi:hypothetical protein